MTESVQTLIFDLGGVLVEFSAFEDLRPLLRRDQEADEIRRRWIGCPLIREFEVGHLTPEAFAVRFVKEWDVVVPAESFLAEFRTWSRGLMPGARDLLESLRSRYQLAALSNSNATHWERNLSDLRLGELFDAAFSSHQLGCHKPDERIYREALERLGVPAHNAVFFDDSAANVQGAKAIGMRAFRVRGVQELRECLVDQGLMSGPDRVVRRG
jgi:putative hydrolase of the HAD superfamily